MNTATTPCLNCKKLEAKIAHLENEIKELKRIIYGRRSEKMPKVPHKTRDPVDAEAILETRALRRISRSLLPEVHHMHHVKDEAKLCPKCGSSELKKVGDGKVSMLLEYVPARLERHVHVQETLACPCGEYIVTADGPTKPVEGGHYGASLMAHVVTAKCVDSIPLFRMEKQFKRAGLAITRSSLCNLFHQTADALKPIYQRMLTTMSSYSLVMADETPLPVQAEVKTHRGFMWSFINDDFILYHYSRTRSGETPQVVLKDSRGTLLVDGYSGYNRICTPDGRIRAGCWAHARRKFFEVKNIVKEADFMLEQIKALYQIEYDAAKLGIMGSDAHQMLRQNRAGPILSDMQKYLLEQSGLHPPKSPMGKAITYVLNNWTELNCFINDSKLPLDNNASERALRIVAIGRKNYLFAGNDEAAENLAGLYSLVATCEWLGINPEQYLADVLIRVHTHPQQKIDELLPHRWKDNFRQ
jgi:transposase